MPEGRIAGVPRPGAESRIEIRFDLRSTVINSAELQAEILAPIEDLHHSIDTVEVESTPVEGGRSEVSKIRILIDTKPEIMGEQIREPVKYDEFTKIVEEVRGIIRDHISSRRILNILVDTT